MYHFTMLQSISKKGSFALLTFKRRIAYAAFFLFTALLSFTTQRVSAQTAGDYRSIINGGLPATVFWGDASTWERYDGVAWVAAVVAPDFNDGVITVRSPTYVRINGDLTIDQTIIENGATIQPNSAGATLTINNGVGTDLELNSFAATVWANNHLLNVTSGALIDGINSNMQYRGLTLINNGTINATFNPRPDVASTTISGVGTIYILKTANNGNCFLAGNQTITNALQFDFGNLITGANKVILTSNAIVQNLTLSNYYVIGNLEMQFAIGNITKNFLVGDAGGYAPVTLTLTGASTTGSVTVSTTNTDHPNLSASNFIANKTVNRFWSVVNNGMVFTNASTTFTWPGADADAGTTPANFKVGKFNGGSWTYPVTTFQNSTSVSATPIAGLGDFQVGEVVCTVTIPDAAFKTALLANAAINTNADGEIQCTEAAAFNGAINVSGLGIANLTGIEAFPLITSLNCSNNNLTSLNISANTSLVSIDFSSNNINNLNFTPNANITSLQIFNNQLSGTLNLSACTNLVNVNFGNNQISSVLLPATNTLGIINCPNNLLTAINVTANPSLTNLTCTNNNITSLDLSQNPNLNNLFCNINQLTSLNIQNGNNTNLGAFSTLSNPLLTCIKVDNVAYMNTNWAAAKDATATYSITCPLNAPAAALNFDGVDDRAVVTTSNVNLANRSFSVEMWLKRNSTTTYDIAFGQGDPGNPANNTALHIGFTSGNDFIFNFYNDDLYVPDVNDGNWHHWACTYDFVTKAKKVYKDGVLVGQNTATIGFIGYGGDDNLYIGDASYGVTFPGNAFDGSMDELRVWNTARTQTQIQAGLNCEIQARPGLLAAYHFNQGISAVNNFSETTLIDAGGNGNTGTLNNFALAGPTSNWVAPGGVVTGTICCNVTLTTSAADTLIVCVESGQLTGSVTLIATGGTTPYIYGGSATTNLAPGIYNYTVTDANGCTASTALRVIRTNCIIPYYEPPTNDTTANLIGAELTQLFNFPNSLVDTTATNNVFLIRDSSNQVLIEVIATTGNYLALKALLQTPAYGMNSLVDNGDSSIIITGFFPIANLPLLNALPQFIRYVRPYFTPITSAFTGLTVTQGDKAMRSDKAKEAWKISGKGIKIGVMSDSYNTKFGNPAQLDVINGDLPGTGNPVHTIPVKVAEEYAYGRATDEGRAMLQIVHDVAPDAALYFRTGFNSADDFAEGIKALRDSGCNVIVDDITYITEPFFNDGVIAKAVDNVTASGVSYFTSAGNFGTKSYEGIFAPIAAPAGYVGMAHDFGSDNYYQDIALTKGTYTITLQWDDKFYSDKDALGALNDLDIYLVDKFGSRKFGFNRNNLSGDPFEVCPFVVLADVEAKIIVTRKGGSRNVRFK